MAGKNEVTRSFPIPKQKCPFCGYEMDRADPMQRSRPKTGDVSLCLKCMEISLFTKDLALRPPTDEEIISIQRSRAWGLIERIRIAHLKLNVKANIEAEGR